MAEGRVIDFTGRHVTKPAGGKRDRTAAAVKGHDTRRVGQARWKIQGLRWTLEEFRREVDLVVARYEAKMTADIAWAEARYTMLLEELHARPPGPRPGAPQDPARPDAS